MSLLQFHQILYLKESCRDTMSVRINHRMTYKARPHLFSPDDFISKYSVNGLIFQAVNGVKLPYGGAVLIADANLQFSVHEIGHFVVEGYNNSPPMCFGGEKNMIFHARCFCRCFCFSSMSSCRAASVAAFAMLYAEKE